MVFILSVIPSIYFGQITILTSNLNPYNVTPQALCQTNLTSIKAGVQTTILASIYNAANEEILSVKSLPVTLNAGVNTASQLNVQIESFIYSSSAQAQYVRTNKMLPSGNYKYCIRVLDMTSDVNSESCQDIVADLNSFLTLISPFNKDTIDTKNPVLIWNHSESFNILSQGEYFRINVAEIQNDQDAEAAINVNNPVFTKSYLNAHSVFYPFEARELVEGKKYAWQVQKISNGNIINKTEAWEFNIAKPTPVNENKYVALKKKLDAGFYLAENNKVYFKFDEQYSSGELKCYIFNSKHKLIKPSIEEDGSNGTVNSKVNGYNRYEINLTKLNLKKGYYTLEVFNEKNEKYLLKFYVE